MTQPTPITDSLIGFVQATMHWLQVLLQLAIEFALAWLLCELALWLDSKRKK